MPAPYWGYLSPEREELTDALMRAQARQMEAQTRQTEVQTGLAEMLGGGGGIQRVGAAPSETDLRYESAQLELMKPTYEKVDENWYVHYSGEPTANLIAASPNTYETDYEIIERHPSGEVERIPKIAPEPGEYMVRNDMTGDFVFYDKRTNDVSRILYNTDFKASSKAEMIGAYADQQIAGAKEKEVEQDFWVAIQGLENERNKNAFTLAIAQMGDITERRGQDIQFVMSQNENLTDKWIAQFSGQIDLARIASTEKVAQWGITSREKIAGVQAAIQMGFLEVDRGRLIFSKYAADKLDLRERELAGLNRGLEVWKTEILAGLQQQGIDIEKFNALTERMEALTGVEQTKLIQRKQNLDFVLGQAGIDLRGKELNLNTAKFEFEKFSTLEELGFKKENLAVAKEGLVLKWYEVGYVAQTKEEAWELFEGQEKIKAMYAPYTQPNMMNEDHVYEWLWRETGIDLFMEGARTDEKIRFETAQRGIDMTPEDVLKWGALSTIQTDGIDALSDFTKNLLFNTQETMDERRMAELEQFKAEKKYEHQFKDPKEQLDALHVAFNDAARMVETGSGFFLNYAPEIQRNEAAATAACFKDILENWLGYSPDEAAGIATFQNLGEFLEAPTFAVGEGPTLSEELLGYKEAIGAVSGVPQQPLPFTPPSLPTPLKGEKMSSSDWREWYVGGFSGSSAATVRSVQEDLVGKGFLRQEDITGLWDDKTAKAFRQAWNKGQLEYKLEGMK